MNTKRQIYASIILILVIIACNNRKNDKTSILIPTSLDNHQGYIQTTKDNLKLILARICQGISYEFTDLYQNTDSIPEVDFMEIESINLPRTNLN